jgi:hypothetical protein
MMSIQPSLLCQPWLKIVISETVDPIKQTSLFKMGKWLKNDNYHVEPVVYMAASKPQWEVSSHS